MTENELLAEWEPDKEYFNRLADISRNKDGILQVFAELNQVCHDKLNGGEEGNLPCSEENRDRLMYRVGEDVYILLCRLNEMPDTA